MILILPRSAICAEIAQPSALQVNLGFVPFDIYDYSHSPSSADAGLQVSCPGINSVRACYQTAFARFHAQYVSGVRFFFGLCGGFFSTPLSNCGQNYTNVSGPKAVWVANMQNFLQDLYSAGIYNIAPTPAHSDLASVSSLPGVSGIQYLAAAAPPVGQVCHTPIPQPVLQYAPGLPYGNIPCTTTAPYYCPSGKNRATYCQGNAGFPLDDGYLGYNCSPANSIFVGWQNLYNVISSILQSAYNTPTAGKKGIVVSEIDVEQELNTTAFPVQARFVVDNSAPPQTGNPDALNSLRYYMGLYGYDIGRVVWSVGEGKPTVAGFNCLSVYQDYARLMGLDSIFSAIEGGYIGTPSGFTATDGLYCGGTKISMFQMPVSHTAPDIADLHTYPCVPNPVAGLCYSDDQHASVQGEAATVYGDVAHFLSVVDPSAVFMVGETHSNSNNGQNETCEFHAPLDAAQLNVAGYNQSALASHSVIFLPWINLPDSASCFSPSNQNVNLNNLGPYTPSQH